MFTVRPYTNADYADFVRMDAATQSMAYWGEADWQPIHPPCDETDKAKRYIVVDIASSQTVGYGAVLLATRANLDVLVHPAWQRRGVGTRLWEQMQQALSPFAPVTVGPWVRAENTAACRWLESLGFAHVDKDGRVQLSVADADVSGFAPVTEQLARHGIVLTTLAAEQEQGSDCLAAFYALFQEVEKDVPGYTPETKTTYNECLHKLTEPGMSLDSVFIAKQDRPNGEYVGLSILGRRVSPEDLRFAGPSTLSQHLTGVHPEHRRKGIATALKLRTIAYAQQQGYQRILTGSDNPAMRALNWKLGFRTGPWLVYSKECGKPGAADPTREIVSLAL